MTNQPAGTARYKLPNTFSTKETSHPFGKTCPIQDDQNKADISHLLATFKQLRRIFPPQKSTSFREQQYHPLKFQTARSRYPGIRSNHFHGWKEIALTNIFLISIRQTSRAVPDYHWHWDRDTPVLYFFCLLQIRIFLNLLFYLSKKNKHFEPKDMEAWKTIFLFNWVILMFHFHFQGCMEKNTSQTHIP